jgi:SAM-dependent methyltransferase
LINRSHFADSVGVNAGDKPAVHRFTGRAEAYSSYRPTYPSSLIALLQKEIGLGTSNVVADVGSGTGILSELFLSNGNVVFGVEPNHDMRVTAENKLARFENRFISVDGSAESTGLSDHTVDLVAIGQALHWFDAVIANRELKRILRGPKHACVLYNDRREDDEVGREYSRIVKKYGKGKEGIPIVDDSYILRFLNNHEFEKFILPNSQDLDYEGMIGRLSSASYMPRPGESEWARMADDVKAVFKSRDERLVTIAYDTRIYLGRIS